MESLFALDLERMFMPVHSLLEIFLRGTIMYLGLVAILRFLLRRQAGSVGIADLLLIVVIADAAQNGFSDEYRSITEGILLVLTIVFWDFAVDWLSFRFPALRKLMRSPPLLLVENGKPIRRNMRKELLNEEELMSELRQQGVERLDEVKRVYMEDDGHVSVIKKKKGG